MAKYKVSYKVLGEQGETLKNTAKMMDDYAQRVTNINSRLGSDQMLASVRTNLQKLAVQLGESRAIINMAGEVLTKNVGGYTALEKRQVTKVDGLKAHNRDFYKNPVVVASAGGAAGGMAGGASAGAAPTPMTATVAPPSAAPAVAQPGDTTLNYTENNTYVTYNAAPEQPAAPAAAGNVAPIKTPPGSGLGAAAVAGIGVGSAALGAAGAFGAGQIKKHAEGKRAKQAPVQPTDEQLEDQLEQAMARVRLLNQQARPTTSQTQNET